MTLRKRAIAWTAGQYILLLLVGIGGPIPLPSTDSYRSVVGWTMIALAGLLTGWAIWSFRTTKIHIAPLVRDGGTLVIAGPYRWVRHPMYLAVLLLTGGLVAIEPAFIRTVSAAFMIPVLIGKLTVEEALLLKAYPNYEDYSARTWRLIPGIW